MFKMVLHQALDTKTPEELFTVIKLDVIHLSIFGYLVYFHVPKDRRNKHEGIGRKSMFVGYCEDSKAFRIYIPGQRKVEINRDVMFVEDATLG